MINKLKEVFRILCNFYILISEKYAQFLVKKNYTTPKTQFTKNYWKIHYKNNRIQDCGSRYDWC